MALCCLGAGPTVREFTVLLIHVLHVSHPTALEGSTRYTREIVDGFFSKHTSIDISHIEPHTHKFRNLAVESQLEIAFVGRPRGYKVPNRTIHKYEHSEGLSVVFEIETRLITRFIPANYEFDLVEVERTDYVPLVGCAHRQVEDMRVSYMNA
jgi:hypothetical protein